MIFKLEILTIGLICGILTFHSVLNVCPNQSAKIKTLKLNN